MITQRDAFFDSLYEIASADREVILVSADMGAPSLDKFRRDLANQYVDVGIAEQQAILTAAGLALGGMKAFVYGIGPFITLRCYEQIRLDLAAMKVPVTIVGVGAGLSYAESGPTHHTTEDLSCLRALPNLHIHNCTDSIMAAAMASYSLRLDHANYVRFDRQALPPIYQAGHDFSPGLELLRPGGPICLVATGNLVHTALDLAREMKEQGHDIGVLDVYRFPLNAELFRQKTAGVEILLSLEEHTLPGGLGSAIAELITDFDLAVKLKRFGCDFSQGFCYSYGGREHLQEIYGLSRSQIGETILKLLND